MSILTVIFLAFSVAMDAFATAIAKGATMLKKSWYDIARMAIIFGIVEGLTTLIGWAIGSAASYYIEAWDHWIAFTLLFILGSRMIYGGLYQDRQQQAQTAEKSNHLLLLIFTAIATSIDSMIVGVSLAFLNVHILLAVFTITIATILMVFMGTYLGSILGQKIGKPAEVLGGLTLIIIGSSILVHHLGLI